MISFHDYTTKPEQDYYVRMLTMMGSLSNLFSESKKPYLHYRITENLFCRCLNAENLSRSDITADARKKNIGIGIKTWIGSPVQKIAEFDASKQEYEGKSDEEIIQYICQSRNERIAFTKRTYGLTQMLYHCTIRDNGIIRIAECPLEPIDLENIHGILRGVGRAKNGIYFTDEKSKYHFNIPKSTLYKSFSDINIIKEIHVNILPDPFEFLENHFYGDTTVNDEVAKLLNEPDNRDKIIYLPLYSYGPHKEKIVMPKSGLNMRFAAGRTRDPYEIYIPISSEFNKRFRNFFPPSEAPFDLLLPDGKHLSAKICQANDKALLSNPNSALGHWLIDDVLKVSPSTIITYEMLEKYGIDSVEIEKLDDRKYRINFAKIGSYESFLD